MNEIAKLDEIGLEVIEPEDPAVAETLPPDLPPDLDLFSGKPKPAGG